MASSCKSRHLADPKAVEVHDDFITEVKTAVGVSILIVSAEALASVVDAGDLS